MVTWTEFKLLINDLISYLITSERRVFAKLTFVKYGHKVNDYMTIITHVCPILKNFRQDIYYSFIY